MAKEMADHLDEDRILAAIVDEQGLDFAVRRHLAGCQDCRARKEAVETRLARLGELSRRSVPLSVKRPVLAESGMRFFRRPWKIRPSFGMGLAAASLLAFLLTPHYTDYLKLEKRAAMEKIYLEMLQDERFMAEIEKLEDDPLPKFYVEITDFTDPEAPDDPRMKDGGPDVHRDSSAT